MADLEIDTAALNAAVMPRVETFVRAFVDRVATQARDDAPERSGRLKGAIAPDPVRRTGPWSVESGVSVRVPYAAAVHEGARPHVIRPRRAAVLSFYWPKVGRQVFFRRVNHPGNAAQPFLRNAAHKVISADPRITLGDG